MSHNGLYILDGSERIRQFCFRNTFYAFLGYCIPLAVTYIASLLGLADIPLASIHNILLIIVIINVIFFSVVSFIPHPTPRFGRGLGFAQLAAWLIVFSLWISILDELRSIALISATIALIYLVSFADYRQSLATAVLAIACYLGVSWYAINALGQSGTMMRELFNALVFLPVALFISSMAARFRRQHNQLLDAKRAVEETRDALWGEMELAKKIQTVLLPVRPAIPGYAIAAHMTPSSAVGGDYYDIITAHGRHWVLIGDVCGHGLPAGLIMMMVHSSINVALQARPDLSPARLLRYVNEGLTNSIRRISEDKYMTIMALCCEGTGALRYAGMHQHLLIYRAESGLVESIETSGVWLGMADDITQEGPEATLVLGIGDTLLLYTDGIVEARDASGGIFGLERLAAILKSTGRGPVTMTPGTVLTALQEFTVHDDITLVALRRLE